LGNFYRDFNALDKGCVLGKKDRHAIVYSARLAFCRSAGRKLKAYGFSRPKDFRVGSGKDGGKNRQGHKRGFF
jgi:hypothetical protein